MANVNLYSTAHCHKVCNAAGCSFCSVLFGVVCSVHFQWINLLITLWPSPQRSAFVTHALASLIRHRCT